MKLLPRTAVECDLPQAVLVDCLHGTVYTRTPNANIRGLMIRSMLLVLMLLGSSPSWAWLSPQEAIEQFLAFEVNGGRLTGDNWKTYTTKYLAASANYDEPGWDEVTIVKSWVVSKVACPSELRCIADVKFVLVPTVGFNDSNLALHRNGGEEILRFNLVKNTRGWFIAPQMNSPVFRRQPTVGFEDWN